MSNTDAYRLKLDSVAQLYNQAKYDECICAYDVLTQEVKGNPEHKKYIEQFIGLKLRSLHELRQSDVMHSLLQLTLDSYNDDLPMQSAIIVILGQFELYTALLKIKANSRYVAGMQYDIATTHELLEHAMRFRLEYDSYEPHISESRIVLQHKDLGEHVFRTENINQFDFNLSLPNENAYIDFSLWHPTSKIQINATLPLPDNDGICNSGKVTFIVCDEQIDHNVDCCHVQFVKAWGPFHLKVTADFGELHIINTELLNKLVHSNE
jgi:hypothetical protein